MVGSIGFGSASAATSVSGLWKPVTADKSSAASSVFQPKPTAEDGVSISKLGQALSGAAADVFSLLDSKTKGKLEDIVNHGVMSADDVALGLRGAASSALFYRYSEHRPRDDEDRELAERHERAGDYLKNFSNVMAEAGREWQEAREEGFALMEKGELDTEGFQEMTREPMRRFQENMDRIRESEDYKNMNSMHEHISTMFKRRADQFNDEVAIPMADQGVIPFGDGAEGAAAVEAKNKLFETLRSMSGGDKSQISALGDAAVSYAKAVDLPFIGHEGLSLEALKRSVAVDQAADTKAPDTSRGSPATSTPAPLPQATATVQAYSVVSSVTSHTVKTNSAVSLLQGALDAHSKPDVPGGGVRRQAESPSDAALGSLLEALKSGSAAPGSLKLDA